MPIVQSEISEHSKQAVGYRVKFKYTFDDGRYKTVGPIRVNSLDEAETKLIENKSSVQQSMIDSDAQEAKAQGLKTAYKEASQANVYYAYLFEGYNTDDPLEAYELMQPVAPDILALGLTVEQMATMFNQDIETAQSVLDKWGYLDSNSETILAYKTVKAGE